MDKERFDLIFCGDLVPGFELAQVKKNLQSLFRIDESKVEVLFSGKAIPLKKALDSDTANKYRAALIKAGADVSVAQADSDMTSADRQPQIARRTEPVAGQEEDTSRPGVVDQSPLRDVEPLATVLGAQPIAVPTPRQNIDAPDFGIAEVGADMLQAHERRSLAAVEVDISSLSVRPQEGNLVDASEVARLTPTNVAIPDYQVASVGADILKPDERRNVQPLNLDVSNIQLADVGADMAPPKPAPPPAPNVDHLELKNN